MVEANKAKSKYPNDRDVAAEIISGQSYVISANNAPHGAHFAADPEMACSLIKGIRFVSLTSTMVARGGVKPAYEVYVSGELLGEVVAAKRVNPLYKPVASKIMDYATFWGIVGKSYTILKEDQLSVDKILAKKNTPQALRAIRDLDIRRALALHDVKIAQADRERTTLEERAALGDPLVIAPLRKKQELIIALRLSRANDEAGIMAKFERPIKLSETRETNIAAKLADNQRKRRRSNNGKGINANKRRRAADLDDDGEGESEGGANGWGEEESERGVEGEDEGEGEGESERGVDKAEAKGEGGEKGKSRVLGAAASASASASVSHTAVSVGGFLVSAPADLSECARLSPSDAASASDTACASATSASASASASAFSMASSSASASSIVSGDSSAAPQKAAAASRFSWMEMFK